MLICLGNFVTNCRKDVTQLPTQTTQSQHKIDTNGTNIDTTRVKIGLYATMLHGKKPKS
jgi:hypothetical protein